MTQTRNAKPVSKARMSSPRTIKGELGVPSNQKWSTFNQDFLPQLRGVQAVRHYREMADNDATIGAILFAIEMLMRQIDWNVEPASDDSSDVEAAAFLESCKDDMSHSWPDFMSTVLTFLPYGWSFHEIVYKQRDGVNSRFDDGRISWAKLAYQPQEALLDWEQDGHGNIVGFKWSDAGRKGFIPYEKGLLFRTTTARGPNGRSVLRNAFRTYQYKKRAEEIMLIGIDRDLNGLPVVRIPAEAILANDAFFEEAKKVATRIKKDEQWGVVWPLEYDENGNSLYEFDVLRSDGASSLSATKDVISQLSQSIADVVLAGFIHLGRDAVGSRALAEPKQQLFQKALQGWVDGIAEVLNRFAVPRLFALNDWNVDALPVFVPEEVEDTALDDLGRFVASTAQAGMDWGFLNDEDPITDQIRQLAGFDSAPEDASGGTTSRLEFDTAKRVYKLKE
jgi:hypothetical protein